MTFEERLDRLTERHEALTQSLQILYASQVETRDKTDKLEQNLTRVVQQLGEVGQFINSLARIAEAHERRIERLEEGNEK